MDHSSLYYGLEVAKPVIVEVSRLSRLHRQWCDIASVQHKPNASSLVAIDPLPYLEPFSCTVNFAHGRSAYQLQCMTAWTQGIPC